MERVHHRRESIRRRGQGDLSVVDPPLTPDIHCGNLSRAAPDDPGIERLTRRDTREQWIIQVEHHQIRQCTDAQCSHRLVQ